MTTYNTGFINFTHAFRTGDAGVTIVPIVVYENTVWKSNTQLLSGESTTIELGAQNNEGPRFTQDGMMFACGFHQVDVPDGNNAWDANTWLMFQAHGGGMTGCTWSSDYEIFRGTVTTVTTTPQGPPPRLPVPIKLPDLTHPIHGGPAYPIDINKIFPQG